MSNELVLSQNELKSFSEAFEFAKKWCSENQWEVGIGEMAVGAALVAWGVHNGVIEMGSNLVATEIGGSNVESIAGAAGGSGIGEVAGSIVGSIGMAGMGGAVGIPAVLVIGGAAAVLGMAGYTAGDVAHNVTNAIDISSLVANGSVLRVGVALIIDGARSCIKNPKVLAVLSQFKEKTLVINELSSKIIASSMGELQGFIEELKKLPEDKVEATIGTGSATLGAGFGASAGGAVAAGSVTVLGSQALGGAAVSLGLVSAPVWPIVAGIAGGAGIGYAAYKAIKYWNDQSGKENS